MDVAYLDSTVQLFYDVTGLKEESWKAAHDFLLEVQNDLGSLFQVKHIIDNSKCLNTKFFALQVLERAIKNRWNGLTLDERDGISIYIWDTIQQLSSNEASFQEERKFYVNKLNVILVEILKHDSSARWQNFIPNYINFLSTADASDTMHKNFMGILKILIEELSEFSMEKMTQEIIMLKYSVRSESILIYQFCSRVLSTSKDTELTCATLSTLHTVLSCIPSDNFFKFSLLDFLVENFRLEPFSNFILECLIEVVDLDFPDVDAVQIMYTKFMNGLQIIFPLNINIPAVYAHGSSEKQAFVQNLARFLTSFYKSHIDVLETTHEVKHALLTGLEYLIKISKVNDTEVQEDCLIYWNSFVLTLVKPHLNLNYPLEASDTTGSQMPFPMGVPRKQLYAEVMSKLRMLMISCMAKPNEVLIVEKKTGNIVCETMRDNDALVQDKIRETLTYLSHLYSEDTGKQMLNLLGEQLERKVLDLNNFNRLSWAIGSIAGSMVEDEEQHFFEDVIDRFLDFCEHAHRKYKLYRADILMNFMYIVGQYWRFLKGPWESLKITVVHKLYHFMHDRQSRVQDMACYTFLKMVQECKYHSIVIQVEEYKILSRLPDFPEMLEPHQIHKLFESFGLMIETESDLQQRDECLQRLMKLPNQKWGQIIRQSSERLSFLKNEDLVREVQNILQIYTSLASSLGMGFKYHISLMFDDMLDINRRSREIISSSIAGGSPYASKTSYVELLRSVQRETLKVMGTFFDKAEDQPEMAKEFLTPVIHLVLEEFSENWPDILESELFSLSASMVKTFKRAAASFVYILSISFFSSTLEMTQTFDDCPERCLKFFLLLRAIVTNCFSELIDSRIQKAFMDLTIWAVQHTERNIAESGLNLLLEMLKKFQNSELCNQFYKDYYLTILELIFGVLTDTFHKPGFKLHVTVLHHLFCLVCEDGLLPEPFWDFNDPRIWCNEVFVREYIRKLLTTFSNKTPNEVVEYVNALFDGKDDITILIVMIRGLLLHSGRFSQYDTELFTESKEFKAALREEKRKIMLSIKRHISIPKKFED